jgi:uncharacterized membrane protein YidH (DUF202 family)
MTSRLDMKDHWAKYRTDMANERNLMAGARTSVAFIGLGLAIIKLFYSEIGLIAAAISFSIAFLVMVYSAWSFIKMKNKVLSLIESKKE